MINPLQAMMAARAANQGNAYGAGVQNTGAVDPSVLLAAQQMNTPSIGQRMDARNSEMVAVDPYKYADLKQQRDYLAAMNARSDNTKMMIANAGALNNKYLADQAYERGKEMADTKYERDQQLLKDADEKARQRALDAERRENEVYNRRLQEQKEAEAAKIALNDERFGALVGPGQQAIVNWQAWTGGENQVQMQLMYKEELEKRALQLSPDEIQNRYKEQFRAKHNSNPTEPIKRMLEGGKVNPEYQKIANQALMARTDFTEINKEIQKATAERYTNKDKSINQNFQAVLATIKATGVSMPNTGDYKPNFSDGNALVPPSLSTDFVPPPMNAGAIGGTSDLDLDTSTPQLQESAGEIESLQSMYDSLMMQAGSMGAKREAERSSNENMFQTGARNLAEVTNIVNPLTGEQGVNPYRADIVGGLDQDEMDALAYAGVSPEDIAMFTNDIDDLPGLDAYSSPKERQAYIKAELERRIAVLQEALANSQNSK